MNVRDAIIQRVTQRIMKMRTAFERFDNDTAEREMVGPKWNVRDLAGHMAHWADFSVGRLRSLGRGEAVTSLGNFDAINDEVYRKNRRMSYVMLLPQLRSAEERVLQVLGAVDPQHLIGETPLREYVDAALIEHYDHHGRALDAAVRRISPS